MLPNSSLKDWNKQMSDTNSEPETSMHQYRNPIFSLKHIYIDPCSSTDFRLICFYAFLKEMPTAKAIVLIQHTTMSCAISISDKETARRQSVHSI